ncbi:bifunctional 5,10-methylene-tetrahydrofolate dehydrogenase/5,10-methylene-tetrahydrofolate cyclohydrolase [Sedimentibacter sp. zth1]|uniref:bifunctional 5,10-methylenetetrahydrofolate dehydrogenase/5,10-methenyltetrahydrofolate cyclohydrolase n=1 Tax=Sedimentibacter sp. zth1 TaxID=2816908 RepID=UPI001A925C2E|nr:tetrahydrofolate dehydrogenase/cyclohydrolase catalytic domain-containing protein [Sedimentibacter sp. zth1]QSX04711.1 bifunctional 5,10-methylene-tetrahydrofolate dehydrogenase/5,10-methylene-tetrahydrofolate cyclohydrolase [Sedimentibacter sp. zth1]
MGILIKGKPVADKITEDVKSEVRNLNSSGIQPKLQIIRVGEREDDIAYERGALKRMAKCGILTGVKTLPIDISQDDFIEQIKLSNSDETVHGILIFRPLPKQLDESIIKYIVDPNKDIDCFNPVNVAKVTEGDKTGFAPCTPSAVMEILDYYDVDLTGKNVVVLGRSMVVGKPQALLMLQKNATVTICHSKTKNLSEVASKADVLVAAIGKAKLVLKEFVKEDAVVIDVGINVDDEGKLCGDVRTDECLEIASMVTPVPAGVGSVTTSVLAKHVVRACKSLIK